MTCTSKLQNNIRNGFPILDNPTKVLSFTFRTLLVLKLLQCPTTDGGHLGFVQYGRHRGSPSWLPREIGRRWSYLPLVQKWCLWNDANNYLIKPPDYLSVWKTPLGPFALTGYDQQLGSCYLCLLTANIRDNRRDDSCEVATYFNQCLQLSVQLCARKKHICL